MNYSTHSIYHHPLIALLFIVLFPLMATQALAGSVKIIELDPLPDASTERAMAVSQDLSKIVVGASDTAQSHNTHAVRWVISSDTQKAYADDLGIPTGYVSAVATSISPVYGKIVGVATLDKSVNTPSLSTTCNRAFSWNGIFATALKLPAEAICSNALSISDEEDVAGSIRTNAGIDHAYLWQLSEDKEIDLNQSEWSSSVATAVIRPFNQSTPWVVGNAITKEGKHIAFIWHDDKVINLETDNMSDPTVSGINYTGNVVGCAYDSNKTLHALTWNMKGEAHSLPNMSCVTAISYRVLNTYAGYTIDGNKKKHAYGTADYAGSYSESTPSHAVGIADYGLPDRGYHLVINNEDNSRAFVVDVAY